MCIKIPVLLGLDFAVARPLRNAQFESIIRVISNNCLLLWSSWKQRWSLQISWRHTHKIKRSSCWCWWRRRWSQRYYVHSQFIRRKSWNVESWKRRLNKLNYLLENFIKIFYKINNIIHFWFLKKYI